MRAIIPPAFITESDSKTISRLVGKRLISPPGRPRAGEEKRRRFVSFIIGYDGEGEPRHNTCDPDKLADNFGRNRGEPHYLTRVHFRRSVLDIYYKDSDRYSAGDGYVKAQGLWLLPVDNDLPDRVIVFLGDLANLPYKEQLHWRSHNILPEGGMSEMAVRRAFLAEPADATSADHAFKAKFEQFQSDWQRRVGWPLFRPLRAEDEHVWKGLHLPTGDTAAEFEEQILFLAKILNDSINDNQLSKALSEKNKNEKSLDKLERYLSKYNYPHVTRDLQILRILQRIRSTATAHRKGANYAKLIEEIGLVKKGKRHVFDSILERLTWMLADVESHFLKGEGVTNPNDG